MLEDFKAEYYGKICGMERLGEGKCICDDGIKQGEIVIWKKAPGKPRRWSYRVCVCLALFMVMLMFCQ